MPAVVASVSPDIPVGEVPGSPFLTKGLLIREGYTTVACRVNVLKDLFFDRNSCIICKKCQICEKKEKL